MSGNPVATQPGPKALLLDRVVDLFTSQGLGDQSLRQIAGALGTSHRMLIYHFGSKDGLLVEVVRAVEARTRGQLARLEQDLAEEGATDEVPPTDDLIRRMWEHLADPAQADFERLFFALYGRALQGDPLLAPLLGGIVDSWVEANAAMAAAQGIPHDAARVHARLGVAVMRGLLLDLLATGDRAGVDAALEVYARSYAGSWWDASTATS